MRCLIFLCVVGLAIIVNLAVLTATSDDSLEAVDLRHPATLLPIVANRMHDVAAAAGAFVYDMVEWVAAPYRERLQRPLPTEPAPH